MSSERAFTGGTDPFGESNPGQSVCGKPCHPARACNVCVDYWNRMIWAGLWDEKREQWTDDGIKEASK